MCVIHINSPHTLNSNLSACSIYIFWRTWICYSFAVNVWSQHYISQMFWKFFQRLNALLTIQPEILDKEFGATCILLKSSRSSSECFIYPTKCFTLSLSTFMHCVMTFLDCHLVSMLKFSMRSSLCHLAGKGGGGGCPAHTQTQSSA